jgi:hypothetical protein
MTKSTLIALAACLLLESPTPDAEAQRAGAAGQTPAAGTAAQAEDSDPRRDPTSPRSRFDLRLRYRDLTDDDYRATTTFRLDTSVRLDGQWLLALRFDLPLVWSDRSGPGDPDGDTRFGSGDFLSQFFFMSPPQDEAMRFRLGLGAQLLWPTAGDDRTGSGKYQLAPSIFGLYLTPGLGQGSFVALVLRDFFSYAGDGDRRDIHEMSVQPGLNINLPRQWFMTLFPDIRINWEDGAKAFVPFDLEIGKTIAGNAVMSMTLDVPIVDDYDLYDWQVELRLGLYF